MENIAFDYGTSLYFILIAGAFVFTAAAYFILRGRRPKTQKFVVMFMAIVNLVVHIFKLYLFPHYIPSVENAYKCTAYTTCALIIITTPFIHISKSGALKDFLFVVGTVAGVFALAFPYSIISYSLAETLSPWEIVRYYLNHYLIIDTSFLPVALGLHKLSYRNFLKIPIIFLVYHITVFSNDCVLICAGYMGDFNSSTLYDGLLYWNPSRSVALTDTSPVVLSVMKELITALTPEIFLSSADGEYFLWPILYYTSALSVGILAVEAVEYLIADFTRIKTDILSAAEKIKSIFGGKRRKKKFRLNAEGEYFIRERRLLYLGEKKETKTIESGEAAIDKVESPRSEFPREEKKTVRTVVFIRPR